MPKKAAKKTAAAKPSPTASAAKPRRVKLGKYQTLKLQKRIKHPVRLPNFWQITKKASRTLWQHKEVFIGITLIYGLLNLVLAQGFSGGTDVSSLKDAFSQLFTGHFGFLVSGLSIFVIMLSSAGNSTVQATSAYQTMLAIVSSLAMIWALRQVFSGSRLRVRDAFYRGMYPLIPFILVLLVIGLQLIPLIIGSTLYSTVINNGIAVYAIEKILWGVLFALLGLLTIYMLSSSLFALYIVTLPDMTPMKALRSARELVRHRRWTVLRKILCLPVILLVAALIIMLPVILLIPPVARWTFFILTMSALLAIHAYMYTLYRELLNE